MITEVKLKIYKKYNGDIDNWVRNGSKNEKKTIRDSDWFLIDNYIQDIYLVRNKLASKEFERTLNNNLKEICENQEVIVLLKKLT